MIRVVVTYDDGRAQLSCPIEEFVKLPADLATGSTRLYMDCPCGIQHELRDTPSFVAAFALQDALDAACPNRKARQ